MSECGKCSTLNVTSKPFRSAHSAGS